MVTRTTWSGAGRTGCPQGEEPLLATGYLWLGQQRQSCRERRRRRRRRTSYLGGFILQLSLCFDLDSNCRLEPFSEMLPVFLYFCRTYISFQVQQRLPGSIRVPAYVVISIHLTRFTRFPKDLPLVIFQINSQSVGGKEPFVRRIRNRE